MQFKNKYIAYKTGSLKGSIIIDEEIKIKTYYYLRRKINGQVLYLRVSNDKHEFTDLSNATSFTQKEATKYSNAYKSQGIKTSIFSCSKNSF